MKKYRAKIYVKVSREKNEVIYSGIEFVEFIKFLPQPMENLMFITGGSGILLADTNEERGLELFEGHDLINKLAKKDINSLGNFCFVDYVGKTSDLSEEQIAELLYMGHMFKPLNSPFFETLKNRFAYLAHDDGWYCKLYCRDLNDFISVLCGKIMDGMKLQSPKHSDTSYNELLLLAESGILIDLDEIQNAKGSTSLRIYTIGEYLNMDDMLNNVQQIKVNAVSKNQLNCANGEWSIS